MVLTQRTGEPPASPDYNQFPYHYGSHATEDMIHKYESNLAFPYHYGSHATVY